LKKVELIQIGSKLSEMIKICYLYMRKMVGYKISLVELLIRW